MKSLKIPDTVETIGFMAFAHITNLATVEFGVNSKLTLIGNSVFYYSGLESITLPNGLRTIGKAAFYGTKLKSINIPKTVTEIEETAFTNTVNLMGVTFGTSSQLKTVGKSAFFGSGITNISLPKSIETIGEDAFVNCKNLTAINVTLGNTKYMTPGGVLYSYDYSELICFPAGKTFLPGINIQTTKIGRFAFAYNDYLTEITLMNKITDVGCYAFTGSDNLNEINIKNTSTILNLAENAFSGIFTVAKIYVPDSLYSQYVAEYPNYNFVKSSEKAASESIVAAGESASVETVPLGEPFILPDDRREYYSL